MFIPLIYDPFFKSYKVTVKVRHESEFKFIVDGKYEAVEYYALTNVRVNIFLNINRTLMDSKTMFTD